jgi:TBC1 domain family protein 5
MEFFQEESILKLLTNVLFVWCKLNPDTSYKQGMNELLASVVYAYFQEAIPTDYVPNNE